MIVYPYYQGICHQSINRDLYSHHKDSNYGMDDPKPFLHLLYMDVYGLFFQEYHKIDSSPSYNSHSESHI